MRSPKWVGWKQFRLAVYMVKYYPLHSNINTQCISYLGAEGLCSVAIARSTANAKNKGSSVNLKLD